MLNGWVAFWHLEQEGWDIGSLSWCRVMQAGVVCEWVKGIRDAQADGSAEQVPDGSVVVLDLGEGQDG
jgi:hypothetical protein